MQVRLSTQARRDLQGIKEWIAPNNPARAVTFIEELRDAA